MTTLRRFIVSAFCLALALPACADSFRDDFDQSVLGPAWTIVPYRGPLPRAHGFNEPANTHSLTARPGYLRYTLSHMTHGYGFNTGYQTTLPGELSCCIHDAGLELHRTFNGERWIFETKIESFTPFTNGRRFDTILYFGDGQPGTYSVNLMRYRDVNQNWYGVFFERQDGTRLPHIARLGDGFVHRPLFGPDEDVGWFRLERNQGLLTASWSGDGTTWTTLRSMDFGHALDGLPQRLVISGGGWFSLAGSYVDWDYVSLQSTGTAPSLACPGSIDVVTDAGWCGAAVDPGIVSEGDPAPVVTCSVAGQAISWPHLFSLGTTNVACNAANGIAPDSSCAFDVTVRDAEAPAISAPIPSARELWPPNHKMRDVMLSYAATDPCGAPQCVLSVSSNEPVNGTGDGDTAPDWEIVDATRVRLRAERAGKGTGRTYTLTITCTDSSGNRTSRSTDVRVRNQ